MEIIFENQFTCTKKYYKECYKAFCFKKPSIIMLYLLLGLNLIGMIVDVVIFKSTQFDYNIKLNIFLDILMLSWPMYTYISNKNLAYRRDLEINQGNPIEIKLLISEESINICTMSNNNTTTVEFANIEKVIKAKNYYIFITKAKLWVAVKKDAFSKGTAQKFEEFIKRKGIKI